MAFRPWNIVKYLRHQLWLLWSCRKIQGEICPQIKQPWALLKCWKVRWKERQGKKKLQEISPSMDTFTCQCTLFVGVRYPHFSPFLVAEEVEKRLVGCVSGSSTTLKTGIDTSTEAGPKLKPVWSIDPCWSMFLGPWCSYLRTLPQKKTLRPAAGRMILHRVLCRILRCDSVSWRGKKSWRNYEDIGYHRLS